MQVRIDRIAKERAWLIGVLALAGIMAALSATMEVIYDVAIFHNAGLRHLAGQRLYADFYLPIGPVAGVLFALFLSILPTGGLALVMLSAATQMVATFCVWSLVYRATASPFHALIGGLFTAFWFQVQIGGFYNDHLSYLFVLAAAVTLLGRLTTPRKEIAVGALLSLPFYTKQTTGLLACFSFFVSMLIAFGWRYFLRKTFFWMILTLLGANALILLLMYLFADLPGFFYYVLDLPFQYVRYGDPENKRPASLFTVLLTPYYINLIDIFKNNNDIKLGDASFYPLVVLIYMSYLTVVFRIKILMQNRDLLFVFSFFLISTILCSAFVGQHYATLTWGLGGVLALTIWLWRVTRTVSSLVLAGFMAVSLLQAGATRDILSVDFFDQKYDLWPVQVRSPDHYNINKRAVLEVIQFMYGKSGSYAVLDEEAYLVPLALGRAPVNPPVYYIYGQTVPIDREERERWERGYIAALEEAEYVISGLASGKTFRTPDRNTGTDKLPLPDVPLIRGYLASEFTPVLSRGGLVIYERKSARSKHSNDDE